jgi:hypothetical protein
MKHLQKKIIGKMKMKEKMKVFKIKTILIAQIPMKKIEI